MATEEEVDEAYCAWEATREEIYRAQRKADKWQNKVYDAELAAERAWDRYKKLQDESK